MEMTETTSATHVGAAEVRRIKTITSHTGCRQFFMETGRHVGYVPRTIHTPYASSPTHIVYMWRGRPVFVAETEHRVYRVYEVLSTVYRKEKDAVADWTVTAGAGVNVASGMKGDES